MKKLLKRTGLEGKQTVFLFTDTQIVHETFLEVSAFPTPAFLLHSSGRCHRHLQLAVFLQVNKSGCSMQQHLQQPSHSVM